MKMLLPLHITLLVLAVLLTVPAHADPAEPRNPDLSCSVYQRRVIIPDAPEEMDFYWSESNPFDTCELFHGRAKVMTWVSTQVEPETGNIKLSHASSSGLEFSATVSPVDVDTYSGLLNFKGNDLAVICTGHAPEPKHHRRWPCPRCP